jgi:hypothetical protein
MDKNQKKDEQRLIYPVMTRIDKAKYDELKSIAKKTKDATVSGLIRNIVYNRKIKVYTHDETTDLLLEELAALRGEIKAIGVNFNQITRYFNTYPEDAKKRFYAKIGFEKYGQLEPKIDRLLELISNLCKRWLSG